jgi:hypothetical protein
MIAYLRAALDQFLVMLAKLRFLARKRRYLRARAHR